MTDPWTIQNTGNHNVPLENGSSDQAEDLLEFEDNFTPSAPAAARTTTTINRAATQQQQQPQGNIQENNRNNAAPHQPLPDSASYLQGLERKLQKIKKSTNLVEALTEKRHDCLRALVERRDSCAEQCLETNVQNNNEIFELETPLSNGESTVQEIYRHLQPIQPITVGETVHIVKYDQLEQQQQQTEANESKEIEFAEEEEEEPHISR